MLFVVFVREMWVGLGWVNAVIHLFFIVVYFFGEWMDSICGDGYLCLLILLQDEERDSGLLGKVRWLRLCLVIDYWLILESGEV